MAIIDIVILVFLGLGAILGLIKGFIGKLSGLFCFAASAFVAYLIASPISSLFVEAEFYQNWVNTMGAGAAGTIILIICFAVCFLIVFILLKLIFKSLNNFVNSGKISGFINKLLGLVFGIVTSLALVCALLLIVYLMGQAVEPINDFLVSDLKLNSDDFTIGKMLLGYTVDLFDTVKGSI